MSDKWIIAMFVAAAILMIAMDYALTLGVVILWFAAGYTIARLT